ncbi:MAG TPA: cation diffusion facilitator family transporter [Nocardioidaceae bacterium]|nr:cation diffusion facilitator family transporter [Nocardioidaceae bacterium]
MRIRGFVSELFGAHSHSHHVHAADDGLESSAAGIRAVKLSLVALAVTAVLQLAVTALSGSVALLADSVHNLGDAMTALPLWVAFAVGRRRATRRYTYGYGRAEDLAGLFVVAMIAASAVVAGWQAISRLVDPRPVDHLWWVAAAGLIGFAGNELVASYRIRVGRRIGSAALEADGVHARTDGLTSLAVVVGAIGVGLGWSWADPAIGLAITAAIVVMLRSTARDVWRRLMDGIDPAIVEQAERVLAEMPGVVGVRQLRMRWIGHRIHAEADLVVSGDVTLAAGHDIAHDAEHRLTHAVPKLSTALVHAYPA